MKIKRFVAPDMRTVLRRVREEQGPDAVILSNRSIDGGVEVVAATDYDEQLAQDALRSLLPQKPATALDGTQDTDPALAHQFAAALRSSTVSAATPATSAAATALAEPPVSASSSRRVDFSAFLTEAKERLARAAAPSPALPAAPTRPDPQIRLRPGLRRQPPSLLRRLRPHPRCRQHRHRCQCDPHRRGTSRCGSRLGTKTRACPKCVPSWPRCAA